MPAEILLVLGRFLLGAIFVFGGLRHFFMLSVLEGIIAARGVPAPRLVLVAGSVFQAIAGALLALGFFVGWAALGLVGFTLAASVMMLNFWDKTGAERVACQNNSLVNIGVVGGLLVAASGAL